MLYLKNPYHMTKRSKVKKQCNEFWICSPRISTYIKGFYEQLTKIGVSEDKIFCKRSLALPSRLAYDVESYRNVNARYGKFAIAEFNEIFKQDIINYYTHDEYAQKTIKLLNDKLSDNKSICIVSTARVEDMSHEKILYDILKNMNF